MTTETTAQTIDITFTGPIHRDEATTGWTIVTVPGSAELLGTRRPVKVGGTIDGHPFRATLLPSGSGPHMLPLNAALRKLIGKGEMGQKVNVHLTERFS